jgi:hypothetical protein
MDPKTTPALADLRAQLRWVSGEVRRLGEQVSRQGHARELLERELYGPVASARRSAATAEQRWELASLHAATVELRAEFERLRRRHAAGAADAIAHRRLVERLEVHRSCLRHFRLDAVRSGDRPPPGAARPPELTISHAR